MCDPNVVRPAPENICSAMAQLCQHGQCVPTGEQTYRCICDAGYEVDANQYCVGEPCCKTSECYVIALYMYTICSRDIHV